uniref:D-glutamate cyclase-like C-terminal domain-containing protein n=1 Tax=Knipowitschia caucasica TaxID=637954 RepID=A0AAV2JHJ0_KNICA
MCKVLARSEHLAYILILHICYCLILTPEQHWTQLWSSSGQLIEPPLAFITLQVPCSSQTTPPLGLDPHLTPLSVSLYSLASKSRDRGINAIFEQDELLLSCLALSHSSSVLITTGFPTHYMHNPPDETDGPPGAVALANMLLSLGKRVTIVTDRRGLQLNQDIINEAVSSVWKKQNIFTHINGLDRTVGWPTISNDPARVKRKTAFCLQLEPPQF